MTLQAHEVHHLQGSKSPSSQDARVFEVADAQITRSASSGQLESLLNRSVTTIRRTWSETVLAGSWRSSGDLDQAPVIDHEAGATTSTVTASGFIPGPPSNTQDDVLEIHIQAIDPKRSSMSRSLSRLARPSWLPSSRLPSPSPSVRDHHQGSHRSRLGEEPSLALPSLSASATVSPKLDRPSKPRMRPLSTFIGKGGPNPTAHPIPNATAKLYHIDTKSSKYPPSIPRSLSSDRLQHLDAAAPRKRDSLSSTFKALDADFQKFLARTSTLKIALVRSNLLPFLKNRGDHHFPAALRPEDLERRVNILNKWWTGLLEMLHGRNGEAISGGERPTILEAVTLLMVRPEWTLPYGLGCATNHPLPTSRSTTSLGSVSSDLLAESIFNNIRDMYAQNLLSQMAYVVEKMSSRTVPASLVSFCGKATAYAFFFCDGIAEILVRLWAPSRETMQRILTQNGVQRDVDLTRGSDCMISRFPSMLRGLTFRSLKAAVRYLRSRPKLSTATACISWHGPWKGRWAGRDSDLFFVFTKFYYNLISDFLPSVFSSQQMLCLPGYVFLQAQLLTVLDSTLQKDNSQPTFNNLNIPSLAFDEVLKEANVSASMLPLPPIAVRSMAENRLILLLRDCVSGSATIFERVRKTFAESFELSMKAAVRRTSLFDHNACFTLCDFLEEAITILSRYSNSTAPDSYTIDWEFWFMVCRQMMESQNTMTEIRLHAFLFSLWGIIAAEGERRRQLCMGWLLDETIFHRTFNHWCPMVRAYYMRLLCWRVGRPNDPGSESDSVILKALARLLNNNWLGFLDFQRHALAKGGPRLSTAPCSPAPSREFLIVRSDSQPSTSSMFITFDSILHSTASVQPTTNETRGSLITSIGGEESRRPNNTPSLGRKKWTLLKGMLPFTSSPSGVSRENKPNSRAEYAEAHSTRGGPRSSQVQSGQRSTTFQVHSFKFSLEWIGNDKSGFGRERQLYQPRLPLSLSEKLRPSYLNGEPRDLYEPTSLLAGQAKYAGRALAEWDLLISEYQTFSKVRRSEGVPSDTLVETPTLGVDISRRPF